MTNPDNAIGTNAAYGGRTSVNAFNDDLAVYSRGIISGWECSPSAGMTVVLGGSGTTRDVAVAEDSAGNKTSINNISGSPVSLELGAAPASNSRIDSIVAYVDNPPQGTSTIADNYEACGLISVEGTVSSSPTEPDDSDIRSAITADGASGVTAYYVVLAKVTITSGTTDLTADDITSGAAAQVASSNVDFTPVFDMFALSNYSTTEQDTGYTWIDGREIYKKTIDLGNLPSSTATVNIPHNVANLSKVIRLEAVAINSSNSTLPIPYIGTSDFSSVIRFTANQSNIVIQCGNDRSSYHGYATIWYTKTT